MPYKKPGLSGCDFTVSAVEGEMLLGMLVNDGIKCTERFVATLSVSVCLFFPRAASAFTFQHEGFISSPPAVTASATTGVTEIRRIGEITESLTLYRRHKRKHSTGPNKIDRKDIEYQGIPIAWKKLIPPSWNKYPIGGIGFTPPDQMDVYKEYPVEVAIYPYDIKRYTKSELLKAFKNPEFAHFTSLYKVGPSMKVELSPLLQRSFEISPNEAVRLDLAGKPVTKVWSVTPLEPGINILVLKVSLVAQNELAGSDWSPETLVLERRIVVEIAGTFSYYLEKALRLAQSSRGTTVITLMGLVSVGVFLRGGGKILLRLSFKAWEKFLVVLRRCK